VAITGAGSGLGAALARRFARAGFDLAITDISQSRAESVLEGLRSSGAGGFCQALDVTSEADWELVYRRVMEEWGGLDVLINNAGIATAGKCEETPLPVWERVIDVDLLGVVRGCHRFLPLFREQAGRQRGGYIINVASFAGFSAMPGLSAYGTAKAGVIALSEHLRTELADTCIGVSVVCPSFVRTNLLENFTSADPVYLALVQRWMEKSKVSADDVAEAVYRAMQQRRFLVLTHRSTRRPWWLKRLWPERYYRAVARAAERTGTRAA